MRRSLLPVLLALPLAAAALPAAAQGSSLPTTLLDTAWRLGDRALDAVDATPAQRRAVVSHAHAAIDALKPHHGALRAWGRDVEQALTAPTVSHEQTETLRRRGLALADAMSADTVEILTDMANELDAEQRRELLQLARDEATRRLR